MAAVAPQLRPLVRARLPNLDGTFEKAKLALRYTESFFDQTAVQYVQQQRVLGFGGSGIVTLWSELDESGKWVRDFAVKSPNEVNDPYFRAEIDWMHTFKTAEHFVQPIYLPEEIIGSTLYNTPDDENGSGAILIMEYFQRCELHDLFARINESASNNWRLPYEQTRLEFIPTRILWRLFLCLTKACVGMAYPPPPEYYGRPLVHREAIRPDLDPEPIIHFDLHPLNVFIDDPVRTWDYIQDHGLGPRFKLGDFSLTQAWNPNLKDEAKIAAASVGKPGYRAPEQLTRDRIVEPYAFGPHTNIWGIGWLMYNALTLYYTDDLDWTPEVCPITLPNGEPYNLNTWAPFLVGNPARVYPEFATYSIELRTLIARCMADRREDRPSLDELMRIIHTNIREGSDAAVEAQMQFEDEKLLDPTKEKPPVDVTAPPPVEDDELLQRFWAEYLTEPPIKEDPYREFWAEDLVTG